MGNASLLSPHPLSLLLTRFPEILQTHTPVLKSLVQTSRPVSQNGSLQTYASKSQTPLSSGPGKMTTSTLSTYATCLAPFKTGQRSSAKHTAVAHLADGSNHAKPTFISTPTMGLPIASPPSRRGMICTRAVVSRQGDRSFSKERRYKSGVSPRLASPMSEYLTTK